MNDKINKIKRNSKHIIWISYITIGMQGTYITLYQYTVLSIAQLFQLNAAMMGVLIALQHFGISLPPLFLGVLSGRIGKKKVILISYSLMVIGTLMIGLMQSFAAVIVSIFIIGAGFSVTEATLSAVLADEFPDESNRHLNFSQTAFSAGALAGPFIAAALIGKGIFFKHLYIGVSAIFLLLGILFYFVRLSNEKTAEYKSGDAFSIPDFFRDRIFLLLAVGILIYVGIENTIANFADSYFELALNAPYLSAFALALFWGAMIPSRFLAGLIKTDTKKIFLALAMLVFFAVLVAMLSPNNMVKIAMFALSGFGCGPLWPWMMDAVAKKSRGSSGPALNIMVSFSGMGGALLPIIAGLLVNNSTISAAYYLSAGVVVALIVVYLSALKNAV